MSGGAGAGGGTYDYKALILYYLREGLYQEAADEAEMCTRKRGNDPNLLFWKAFAVGMTGAIPAACKDLESLRAKRDMEFAAVQGLLYFQKKSRLVDRDAVETMEAACSIASENSSDAGVIHAARFLWLAGEVRHLAPVVTALQANETCLHLERTQPNLCLDWRSSKACGPHCEAFSGRGKANSGTVRDSNTRDLDTIMGKAKYHTLRCKNNSSDLAAATDHLNHAISLQAWFWPALVEKAKLLADSDDWDQATDLTQRVLSMEDRNIPALTLDTLCGLVQGRDSEKTMATLKKLCNTLHEKEGRNAGHLLWVAQLFARICGRNPEILRLTIGLVETAGKLVEEPKYLTELGYQRSLAGSYTSAMAAYQQAGRIDESHVGAVHGMIYCQIQEGLLEDAEQQLEFLTVLQDSIGSSPQLFFLRALLKWRQERQPTQHVTLLDECSALHSAAVSRDGNTPKPAELRLLTANPDFMMELAREYLLHMTIAEVRNCNSEGPSSGMASTPADKGLAMLESVVQLVPGVPRAHVELGRAHFAAGSLAKARKVLHRLLELAPSSSEANLLAAQVSVKEGEYRAADNSLEQALSCDFRVRSSPLYHLIRAQVLIHKGSLEEAKSALEEALRLPGMGVKHLSSTAHSKSVRDNSDSKLPAADRVSIFVEMINVLSTLNMVAEAQDVIAEAQALFRGTPDEVRILIASSELAIRKNDLDKAIKILTTVPVSSPVYMQAQLVKAGIYLRHRHDKRAYMDCYRALVDADPSAHTYLSLGDAYMTIQMPEDAVDAFESALRLNPNDATLAAKIAKALVATHDFRGAIDLYRKAVASAPEKTTLRHDLARLCAKLKRHGDAVAVLEDALAAGGGNGLNDMMTDVETLSLLGEV
ncbi:unnamed protein product, partial [Chrysoparadoxa australica]